MPIALAAGSIELPSRFVSYTVCSKCPDCTGLFLDTKTMLTAAHCAQRDLGRSSLVTPWGKTKTSLVMDCKNIWKTNRHHIIEDSEYSLHINPQYDEKARRNDLMIIKFKERVVLPRPSPSAQFVSDNDLQGIFLARGFGGTRRGRGKRKIEKLSESRVIPLKLYRNVRGKIFFTHTSNEATCFGDSGGMTYLQRPDGQVKLVAVVSGAGQLADNPEVCSAKNYSFHTWLYPHLEWIRDLMEKETD